MPGVDPRATVFAYHDATKHRFDRSARGPGQLDWTNQPDPFRRYRGAALLPLQREPAAGDLAFADALSEGSMTPCPLAADSLSTFFYHSLAISSWKEAGGQRWALRVNPSSGNLHPTEGYLVTGPVTGLAEAGFVGHYAPREHALEVRAELPRDLWLQLAGTLPPDAFLVGLTSIHWREMWKYGERAFRYCQHDVGHAIAAASYAAALVGWRVRLVEAPGTVQLASLLGLRRDWQVEREIPECLLAVTPAAAEFDAGEWGRHLAGNTLLWPSLDDLAWCGEPNPLSSQRRAWPVIDDVTEATRKPPAASADTADVADRLDEIPPPPAADLPPHRLAHIVRRRRSAVSMDSGTTLDRAAFFGLLETLLPLPARIPFASLPWRNRIDMVFFVHRIDELSPGVYILVREPQRLAIYKREMRSAFTWDRVADCPDHIALYQLAAGDVQDIARALSCHQSIAADGCFSLGMLADFAASIERYGPWFYPRLFWEAGALGQALYLAAEAYGLRGTGIGCFFDDPVHDLLHLKGDRFQSLYHFTVGGGVDDGRLTTLPAYLPPAEFDHG